MKLRFVVDAQLPLALAKYLEACGHAVEHVNRIRLGGSSDGHIWSYVVRQQAILITKDEDFLAFAQRFSKGPTVVWIRLGNTRNRALLTAFTRALPSVIEAIAAGERVIVIE